MSKLSISKPWDETKDIIARDGKLLVAVALALFVLPGVVLDLSVPPAPSGELPPPGPWIAIACVAILISLVGQLAVIRLAMGPHLTVREAIGHGARRLLPYVGAVIIWLLPFTLVGYFLYEAGAGDPQHPSPAAALGFLITSCVALFLAVRLILSSPVASSEAVGPVAILARSWAATRGNWWRLFGFMLLYGIGTLALIVAVQSVFGIIARLLLGGLGPWTVGGLLVALVGQLISAAASSVFFVMLARIYVQLAGRESPAGVPSSGT
jgi:hypothetical protein